MASYSMPAPRSNKWLDQFLFFFVELPWKSIFLYPPSFGLGLSAAYASAQWAQHNGVLPAVPSWLVGASFEYIYIASVGIASYIKDQRWFYGVNIFALICSIIYVTLHAADRYGLLAGMTSATALWVFALVHGIPLATLNFTYSMLVHQYKSQLQQEIEMFPFQCDECGRRFRSQNALNGHQKRHPRT